MNDYEETTAEPVEDRALPGLRMRVTIEGEGPYVVRITNQDRVRWDLTAPRQGWGKAQDVPFLAQTFMAWSASRREKLTDLNFERFRDAVIDLEDLKQEPEDVARPTR